MILLLLGAALASPATDAFPQRVAVHCPSTGLCRVEVPPPFVAANDRSWMLLRADGELQPFAVLQDDVSRADLRSVTPRPTEDPRAVSIRTFPGRASTEVHIEFRGGRFQTTAHVETRRAAGQPWRRGPEEILAGGLVGRPRAALRVPDPEAAEIRLVFGVPWVTLPGNADVELAVLDPGTLAPAHLSLPVVESGTAEDGNSRYTFVLPGMARLHGLRVVPEAEAYERPVSLEVWQATVDGLVPFSMTSGSLRRLGADAEPESPFDLLDLPADRFALSVDDGYDTPLSIPSVEAVVARRVLLIEDGGDLMLYGGDPSYDASFDLQLRRDELVGTPSQDGRLDSVEANPSWQDPLDAAALEPGAPVDRQRFRFSRAVQGSGVVRLDLPADVQTSSRSNLSDLRLLDAEDHQIPYVIYRGALPRQLEGLVRSDDQDGAITRARLTLPQPLTPISSVSVESPDHAFTRTISLLTGDGGGRRLLSVDTWMGAPQGSSRRRFAISEELERALVVEVDNGDNKPITLGEIKVYGPTISLLARLPEGGATLVYGDLADVQGRVRGPFKHLREADWDDPLNAPVYDAMQLADTLSRAPASTASLGPAVELSPQPSATDRGAVAVGIGVLVLGLVGLTGWLLKDLRREQGTGT